MPTTETGIQNGCIILPFQRQNLSTTTATTTTLAALLAVTVIHDASVSAEERLIEIIEQSGEVEVLDTEDALADLGLEPEDMPTEATAVVTANDNNLLVVT